MPFLTRVLIAGLLISAVSSRARAAEAGPYLIVVGMASEAKVARGPRAVVITGAMREKTLREKLRAVKTEGFAGVISFGVAAGLDEQFKVGLINVPARVVYGDKAWPASQELSARIRVALQNAKVAFHPGDLTGVPTLEAGTGDWRRSLRQRTSADVADMESHIAAEFAAERKLPFAAVRVLSDTVGDEMPPAALEELDTDGRVQTGRVARSVWRQPSQLPLLMKTAKNFRTALKSLKTARKELDFLF